MQESEDLYIGLISGTSVDCVDAVLVDFSKPAPQLVECIGYPFPEELKQNIQSLMLPGDNEIDRMGVADQLTGRVFADAALHVLAKTKYKNSDIAAIGSHGQTIRHRPKGELSEAFTVQIGDPNIIAEQTGITTVADFRRRDMAAGGQGAPLVPAFHHAVFHSENVARVIVNIGGIGNITSIPTCGEVIGFDTGPGNALMDEWIAKHKNKNFDENGDWASTGSIDKSLLKNLLSHPYFFQATPKSTGREMFTLPWLEESLCEFENIEAQDVQATLLELTAVTICNDIKLHTKENKLDQGIEVFICGGGALNQALLNRLSELLAPYDVQTTSTLGIDPEWVEAMAFAWLAKQTLEKKPGNLATVTGAKRDLILGGIYW